MENFLFLQIAAQNKNTRTLFHKESGSGTNCMVEHCQQQSNL